MVFIGIGAPGLSPMTISHQHSPQLVGSVVFENKSRGLKRDQRTDEIPALRKRIELNEKEFEWTLELFVLPEIS